MHQNKTVWVTWQVPHPGLFPLQATAVMWVCIRILLRNALRPRTFRGSRSAISHRRLEQTPEQSSLKSQKSLSCKSLYELTKFSHPLVQAFLTCAHVLSCFSHVWLFATPWAVARQAPLSMGFSRPEYWSGLPCPPPMDLPNPGIESLYLISPALAGRLFTTSATWE